MDFFARPADVVAPLLLNAVLTHDGVSLRITEVEAYLGINDPASHAARGLTNANAALFGPPGHLYVYHSYGIHKAGNIVAHPHGESGGVLIRAGEIVAGQDVAKQRRGQVAPHKLASGPGNVGKALGLLIDDNSTPISLNSRGAFSLELPAQPAEFVSGPRIGITKNPEAPLRFWILGERTVSGRKTPI
ncbi:DNA-3-methyladenine glycosylase [Corynebacterium sp. H128]|uniref:DNA-3-methyladenine glycosylase n=1 Tax=Corynebacterium sp. H128 TaxID=3133427 RepID=UPI003098ED45